MLQEGRVSCPTANVLLTIPRCGTHTTRSTGAAVKRNEGTLTPLAGGRGGGPQERFYPNVSHELAPAPRGLGFAEILHTDIFRDLNSRTRNTAAAWPLTSAY